MNPGADIRRRGAAGFTLLETLIAASIFSIVGYTIAAAFTLGTGTQRTVAQIAGSNQSLRKASSALTDELRATSDARITVTPMVGGNDQLDFMLPIDVAGAATWGVHDAQLGATPALQNRLNWSLRYTVVGIPDGEGGVVRQLVRQILDTAGAVQRQNVIAHNLRSGADDPPGFSVAQVGDVWEIGVATNGQGPGGSGRETSFHVRTRN